MAARTVGAPPKGRPPGGKPGAPPTGAPPTAGKAAPAKAAAAPVNENVPKAPPIDHFFNWCAGKPIDTPVVDEMGRNNIPDDFAIPQIEE